MQSPLLSRVSRHLPASTLAELLLCYACTRPFGFWFLLPRFPCSTSPMKHPISWQSECSLRDTFQTSSCRRSIPTLLRPSSLTFHRNTFIRKNIWIGMAHASLFTNFLPKRGMRLLGKRFMCRSLETGRRSRTLRRNPHLFTTWHLLAGTTSEQL